MQGLKLVLLFLGAISATAIPLDPPPSGGNSTDENHVMYSYSEAVVGPEGKPAVSQLTIVKGKDGEFHYAKNENGEMKKGKWEGPLPTTPATKVQEAVTNTMKDLTNDLINPIKILQDSIGSSVQDFLLKAFNF